MTRKFEIPKTHRRKSRLTGSAKSAAIPVIRVESGRSGVIARESYERVKPLVPRVIHDAGHSAWVGGRHAPDMTLVEHGIINDVFH